MREEQNRGAALGLNEDEVAFYDALETNDSAVKVLGDDTLALCPRAGGDCPKEHHNRLDNP